MSASSRRTLRPNPHGRIAIGVLLAFACLETSKAADLRVDVRDPAGQPLADVVVYAEPVGTVAAPRAADAPHTIIDQINKEFVPRVTVIQTGTLVEFPNSDKIRHEVYSFSPAKVFTSKLYAGKQAPPVVFDTPGTVALGCNIHDQMEAWVRIVNTPYFAKSAADGTSTLTGLKAGDYRLNVWYPAQNSEPQVKQVHVGAEGTTRELVQIALPAARAAAAVPPATP